MKPVLLFAGIAMFYISLVMIYFSLKDYRPKMTYGETDASIPMTPEEYRKYIEASLKGVSAQYRGEGSNGTWLFDVTAH